MDYHQNCKGKGWTLDVESGEWVCTLCRKVSRARAARLALRRLSCLIPACGCTGEAHA